MRKLFALEDAELEQPAVELETAPEVGEVATVELETTEATSDIQQDIDVLESGIEAVNQLEKVEKIVESTEKTDGLTPEAAEAVKVAVECICNTIGANPKAIFSIYATENFKSASTRKANTAIAKEGISNFIYNLWRKIKDFIKNIWEKIVTFWRTYVVGLEKIKRSINSMIEKLKNNNGKLTTKTIEKAPSNLINAFASTSNEAIGVNLIKRYLDACSEAQKTVKEFIVPLDKFFSTIVSFIDKASNGVKVDIKDLENDAQQYNISIDNIDSLGSPDKPLVGGIYVNIIDKSSEKYYNYDNNNNNDTVDVVVYKHFNFGIENNKIENNVERGLNVASISDMVNILRELDIIIDKQIEFRDVIINAGKNIDKNCKKIDKIVDELINNYEKLDHFIVAEFKYLLSTTSAYPKLATEIINIISSTVPKLANATLSYVNLCNKYYK